MNAFLIAHVGHTSRTNEHVVWWAPDRCGYAWCVDNAGLYSESEARSICHGTTSCIAVAKEVVESLSLGTPYYRRSDGSLDRLYDGGEHNVVPNTRDAWKTLMAHALPKGEKTVTPTPIGSRSRAIYLPEPVAAKGGAA